MHSGNSFLILYNLFSYLTAREPILDPWITFYSNVLIDCILLCVPFNHISLIFGGHRRRWYRPHSDPLAFFRRTLGCLACDWRRRGDPNDTGVCSTLTAFESEGVFNVPHLLWHGISINTVSSEELTHLVASRHSIDDILLHGTWSAFD